MCTLTPPSLTKDRHLLTAFVDSNGDEKRHRGDESVEVAGSGINFREHTHTRKNNEYYIVIISLKRNGEESGPRCNREKGKGRGREEEQG